MSSDYTPQRIVSLQPSATVILESLGQAHRIVACTKYCVDLYPELRDGVRTIVTDSWTAKADQIKAARPDLVIASVPYQEKSVVEILRAGKPLLGLSPRNLSDVYKDIALIAGVVGELDRGDQIIQNMKDEIESARQKTLGLPRPRVFCEEWGKPLIASQLWVSELVQAAGGEFVGIPGTHTTAENILMENPDIFIAAWCGAGNRVPLEKIVRDRGWQEMRAVQHGNVYCIRDEYLNTPAPTLLKGLAALTAAIHPNVFPRPADLRQIGLLPKVVPAGLPEM